MIVLHFDVPESFNTFYCLTGTQKSFFTNGDFDPDIHAFQQSARKLDSSSNNLIRESYIGKQFMEEQIREHRLSKEFRKIDQLLEKLKSDKTYPKLLGETNKSLVTIRKAWEDNLAKLLYLHEFLLDGKDHADQKVFVTVPMLNLCGVYDGDIYITTDRTQPYSDCLNLWKLLISNFVTAGQEDPSDPRDAGNREWLKSLITELCNAEVLARLCSDSPNEITWDKTYKNDFDFLLPEFKAFLKSDGNKRISDFQRKAMLMLKEKWAKR